MLRKPQFLWGMALVSSMVLFGIGFGALISIPSKWDKATAIGVCDGLPVLRQVNGTIWLRVSTMRVYRIEGEWRELCR
jgi:hypothetical protein